MMVASLASSAMRELWKMLTVKKMTALTPLSCWFSMRKMHKSKGCLMVGSRAQKMLYTV